MIRWIFLDVGNVIMNDDPVMAFIYQELHQALLQKGLTVSFDELLAEREQFIRERGAGHWYEIGLRYLGVDAMHSLMHHCAATIRSDYMAYHNVIPGMDAALEELSREFHLGLLANQLREVLEGLSHCGLRRHFRVLALSELIDLKKPDPEIFLWALREAGCRPEEAIMVGDRVDNDILPAQEEGMWTIWFHAPLTAKGYTPPEGMARRYFESQLRASVADRGPQPGQKRPHGEARSAAELVSEAKRLRALSAG